MVMGALLWIGQVVNSILLVALSAIEPHQAAVTEDTMTAVHQLLIVRFKRTELHFFTHIAVISTTNQLRSTHDVV